EAERQAFEQRLLETQKLESLGVLAGGIAHEFNNVLMGVLGNTTLAKRELPPDSNAHYSLQKIEDAANRAAGLTQQLLLYSGRKQFALQQADLNVLVEEMGRLAQVSFGIDTRLVLQLGELPPIEADAAQLRQLIVNLVTNAAEAIGDAPGQITITTGAQSLSSAYLATTYLQPSLPSGEYVFLSVADTGPGIDPAVQAHIFEPFYTTKFPGRGLGLAAAVGVVRGQGGALTVHSEPGRGCTFTVYFPASAAASPQTFEEPTLSQRADEGVVLVVENNTSVRTLATRMLERLGFAVVSAADGRAGVELFRSQADQIACVLLDLHMPIMDGRQALHEILQIRPAARVLMMTNDSDWRSTSQLNDLKLAGVVHKPFSADSLHAHICRALAPRAATG
ncbi:MAG TPA: ATP-binding protein, partial [Roseiflexaceae bacterium]|nr:ATP-binding protein [Roseiflexaceae bacterium]